MKQPRTTATGALTALLLAAACGGAPSDDALTVRGRGLAPATLSVASSAAVYDAAARAAFDVGPGLVLLLHPRQLPRTAGTDGGEPVAPALVRALREAAVVRGLCEPKHDMPRDTPHCGSQQAGYVVRATPVLQMPGDTLELYFAAEAFGSQRGPRPVALRFEKIYQLVPSGERWRVAREARVKTE
jgi:hypothetical protein